MFTVHVKLPVRIEADRYVSTSEAECMDKSCVRTSEAGQQFCESRWLAAWGNRLRESFFNGEGIALQEASG